MSNVDHGMAGGGMDYGTTSGVTNHSAFKKASGPDVTESVTSDSSSEDEQAGVKAIEAIAKTWSPWSLAIAYIGWVTPFEHFTVADVQPLASA